MRESARLIVCAQLSLDSSPDTDARATADPGAVSQKPPERRRSLGRRNEDRALEALAIQDAFVALTDGIILTDPGGRIVSANPAAFRVLGEDTLTGRPFEELLLVTGAATSTTDCHHFLVRVSRAVGSLGFSRS